MDNHETAKKESLAIVVVILLLLVGSVFYGVDVFKKAKAGRAAAQEQILLQ